MDAGFDVQVYSECVPEPTLRSMQEATDFAREVSPNFVIGLGGGSSIDNAKVISVALTNPGNIRDYLPPNNFSRPGVPCISIPTTSGSGAEVTSGAAVTLEEEGVKGGFKHHFLFPTVAIIDPAMALTMPPKLTASTGIDALTHAVEASLSIRAFPLTKALGYMAIELISKSLVKATYFGNDIEARYDMSAAAFLACSAETNAGPVEGHAFGLVVGAFYHLPHGIACGLALPYVMEHNLPVGLDTLVRIGTAMGEDARGLTRREAAYKVMHRTRTLIKELGLPTALKDVGKRDDIPRLVTLFTESPWITGIFNNCMRRMTKENAQKLFDNIFEGRLGKA